MAIRLGRLLIAAIALIFRCNSASFCTSDPVAKDTRHQFEIFAGYSPQSATLIGATDNRRFVLAGFEYSYRCWAWQNTSISLTPGILPAAILLEPTEYVNTRAGLLSGANHSVYGFGIVPIGFTFHFARRRAVHPFFETTGGMITSTKPIPVDLAGATSFNFLFDFGGGVQWALAEKRAVSFGYKFLHISNANISSVNPGVDNNVFYAGFSFLR